MKVTQEQAGTYRQIAPTLRIARPGRGEVEQSRPRRGGTDGGPFIDSASEPTLIAFEAGDPVNIEALICIGAIAPVLATQPAAEPVNEAVDESMAESLEP